LRPFTSVRGHPPTADLVLHAIPSSLQQVVTTVSRAPEKVLDAPATVSVVTHETVNERPTTTLMDHITALPGVDIAHGGLLQANTVTRGFNNIFSGALLVLTDNRFANVPSLRANVPYLIPTTNEDVDRMEVVLGPAAALYGPNAAGGVLNIITRSPFSSQGTQLTVDAGERSTFRGSGRTAGLIGSKIGYKFSYQYFSGHDWRPPVRDPLELVPRDFNLVQHGGEARVDFRPTSSSEFIANVGQSVAVNAVEPTGLGPGQVKDWTYRTYQLRGRYNRFFAQAFMNTSNAGQSFLLRTLQPIFDQSHQFAAELQHGFDFGWQSFIYGMDYLKTTPNTGGTINGRNENDDGITEVGGYVHSVTHLSQLFDVVAAARVDSHSRLDAKIFSPRLALVFKPTDEQNFRVTFNHAFSTPTSNNLFLDLLAGRIPSTGTTLFGVRALGVPSTGLQFMRNCTTGLGSFCMRVPAAFGGGTTPLPADAALLYKAAIGAAGAKLIAGGVPAAVVSYLGTLQPTSAQVGTQFRTLNSANGSFLDVAPTDLNDVPRISAEITNSYEFGYKASIAKRFNVSLDVWNDKKRNFVGPLIVETPNVFLQQSTLQAYLTAQLTPVVGAAQAAGLAAAIAPALAGTSGSSANTGVPLGVVNFSNPLSSAPDVIVTYRNFGKLSVWGSDIGTDFAVNDLFTVGGTYSYVNKDFFPRTEVGGVQDISLNAPKSKGSLSGRYHDDRNGLAGELRWREVSTFPVYSFINGTIPSYGLVDAMFSVKPDVLGGWMWSVNANNLFNKKHVEFVGGGQIGRLIMTRLQRNF
jgi:Outer membrane cobalamin receptor protein